MEELCVRLPYDGRFVECNKNVLVNLNITAEALEYGLKCFRENLSPLLYKGRCRCDDVWNSIEMLAQFSCDCIISHTQDNMNQLAYEGSPLLRVKSVDGFLANSLGDFNKFVMMLCSVELLISGNADIVWPPCILNLHEQLPNYKSRLSADISIERRPHNLLRLSSFFLDLYRNLVRPLIWESFINLT